MIPPSEAQLRFFFLLQLPVAMGLADLMGAESLSSTNTFILSLYCTYLSLFVSFVMLERDSLHCIYFLHSFL